MTPLVSAEAQRAAFCAAVARLQAAQAVGDMSAVWYWYETVRLTEWVMGRNN